MAHPKAPAIPEVLSSAFERAAEILDLEDRDRQAILGDAEGQVNRVGMFLEIFDHAEKLLGNPGPWFKVPNRGAPFKGKAPLAFVLEDPAKNLHSTLQYVLQAASGWA